MEKGNPDYSATAIIQINPGIDPKVEGLVNEVQKILTYANQCIIVTDDDLPGATNDLTIIANLTKAVNEKKKEYTDPINTHLKTIREAFDLIAKPLTEADQIIRRKIMVYRSLQDAHRLEVERINRLRIEAAEAEAKLSGTGEISQPVNLIPEAPPPVKKVSTEAGSLGTMIIWKFEVIDFAKLPDRFKIENATLIGKVVRAGEREIPGVRIWQEETLTVKAR